MKKSFFIGGDFVKSQYLWIIPFADGYCKKNKIEKILFEVPPPKEVMLSKPILYIKKI